MLPALAGLGAPHWRADAKGTIHGLTLGTKRAHIVRAALESLSHQLHDLAGAFAADGMPWRTLCIDGGMSANDRSEEHTSELQSLMRISYAVFCLKKKK